MYSRGNARTATAVFAGCRGLSFFTKGRPMKKFCDLLVLALVASLVAYVVWAGMV